MSDEGKVLDPFNCNLSLAMKLSKVKTCGERAFYYILKDPPTKGEIKILLCRDHLEGVVDFYHHFLSSDIVYCEARI